MSVRPSTLAVIPARGGSKSIPCKPLARINNRTLLEHTVVAAMAATCLDKVIVSTDHDGIATQALRLGVEVLHRPVELAADDATTAAVLSHAGEHVFVHGHKAQLIVTLQPTSPLRPGTVIDKCVEEMVRNNADSVVTVCRAWQYPEWMYLLDEHNWCRPLMDENRITRRQDAVESYVLNGAVYVSRHELVTAGQVFGGRMKAVVMSRWESVDIDEPEDLLFAEAIMSKRGGAR